MRARGRATERNGEPARARECSAIRLPVGAAVAPRAPGRTGRTPLARAGPACKSAVSVAGAWSQEAGWATTMTDHRHRVVLVVYYPSSACRPWFEGIRSLDCQFAMARTDAAGSSRLVDDWWMGLDCQPWR